MKIEVTREDALHHDFTVEISAEEYAAKVDEHLTALIPDVKISGFRPGKVPLRIMRQRFGDRIHGELVEKLVDESVRDYVTEKNLNPAMQPKLEIKEFDPKKGLSFTAAFILLSEIDLVDLKTLAPTRYVITPEDDKIDAALEEMRTNMRTSEPIKRKRKAKQGDLVVIDFVGSIDGEKFDGGAAEGHRLELGSNQFIPGFEDQIVGMNKGDQSDITVTFPEDYGQADLAGKDAVFAVTVQDIHDFVLPELDDKLAEQVGLENLTELRDALSDQMSKEYTRLSDEQLRRDLFDLLDEKHDLEIADEMLDAEYTQLEGEYKKAREAGSLTPEEMAQSEEEGLSDLRKIAERRVRLALILAEFAKKLEVGLTEEDMRIQLTEEAREFRGYEQQFIQHVQNNKEAMQQLQSRAQESAMVRVMLELIKPEEKEIPLSDFEAMQAEQDKSENKTEEKPKAKKKAPAKKAAAKKAPAKKETAKKAPAKKAPAKKKAKKADE